MSKHSIRFLDIEDVLLMHRLAIEDQGGDGGIRDIGLLEAAVAAPRQQYGGEYANPTIPAMAAAYAFHICSNHPFLDGNKRAALAALLVFLTENGWTLEAKADELESVIMELAAGQLSKSKLTKWVERHTHKTTSGGAGDEA